MFKPKPEEKLKPVTTSLSEQEIILIEDLANKYGCNRSSLIRQLVQFFIQQETKGEAS